MALLNNTKTLTLTSALTFTFTVPGHQIWYPRSVYATATRGAGGSPNRDYQLAFATSTGNLALVGAADAGADPGTCTVTWANVSAATVGSGNVGVSVAPIPTLRLEPGYTIVGTILNHVSGDTWNTATVWFDYIESSV